MKKYRKKPVVIEAVQWDETKQTLKSVLKNRGLDCVWYNHSFYDPLSNKVSDLSIYTSKGSTGIAKGDYIVKEANDDFAVYKPDIFEASYEEVKE